MLDVAGGKEERDGPGARLSHESVEEVWVLLELCPVTPAESGVLCRIVAEPSPEFRGRGDLLEPCVEAEVRPSYAARPQAVDQVASPIRLRERFVDPLRADAHRDRHPGGDTRGLRLASEGHPRGAAFTERSFSRIRQTGTCWRAQGVRTLPASKTITGVPRSSSNDPALLSGSPWERSYRAGTSTFFAMVGKRFSRITRCPWAS